ncbi:MAG: hypothetical protein MJZ37_06520 [Bacilli bacterium]|nr:hypothetical protein [Bacilli bacterium]
MLPSREYGLKNEKDIIDYLNEKRFKDLNEKWKNHIKHMFPFVIEKDLIHCSHYEDQNGKPDIVITVRHTNMYVSIKTGKKCSMHQEPIETFLAFLKKKGVSDRTLKIIKFYQYGETEKLNNNGRPFTPKELEEKFKDYFTEASKDLDKLEIIDAVIFRSILKGCVLKRYKVNYLYYGNLETGYLLSEEDIYSLVLQYRNHDKTAIHFGGLNLQPARRERSNIKYHDIRIKWPILSLLYYRSEEELRDIVKGKIKV